MSTARRIYGSTIACVLLAFAMTSAATARALQDHRSPDARDAAQTPGMSETTSPPPQDPRPRTRDAATDPGTFNAPRRDLATSPHRPAACGHGALQALAVTDPEAPREAATAVKPPQPTPVRSDHGIDWHDAASPLGVIALGSVGAMTILQRRPPRRRTATVH